MDNDDAQMQKRIAAVGHLVRDHREARGLKIAPAAKLAGIHRNTWTAVELGKTPVPSGAILGSIAAVLELSMAEIRGILDGQTEVDELTPLGDDMLTEIRLIRQELQLLGAAYAQLAGLPPAPSSSEGRSIEVAEHAAPRSKPAGIHKIRP